MSRWRLGAVLAGVVLPLVSLPAAAWQPIVHESAVRAAIRISPAAEARLPTEHRSAIFESARDADPLDPQCEEHPGLAPNDAAAQAEKALARILLGRGLERPYARAQAIGQYLHFVADCAVPRELGRESLFMNRSFVVLRQPRPLTGAPLAVKLRERLAETAWADPGDSARTMAFRGAVNLIADALLLLPVRAGAPASPKDEGPAIFILDTIDNGRGSDLVKQGTKVRVGIRQQSTGLLVATLELPGTWDVWRRDPASLRLAGLNTLASRRGVQVAEWASRGTSVRVLLVNNDHDCATGIRLQAGSWSASLPGTLAPLAAKVFTIEGPPGLSPDQLRGSVQSFPCSAPFPSDSGQPTDRRVLVSVGPDPQFDVAELGVPKPQGPLGTGGRLKDPPPSE